MKHVNIVCPDGVVLLTYTGLAWLPDKTPVADLVRRVLSTGMRSVEATVLHLTERATAEISTGAFGSEVLAFGLSIFDTDHLGTGADRALFVMLTNEDGCGGVLPEFRYHDGVVRTPAYFHAGSGVRKSRRPTERSSDG